ncbi:serine hydrolase domain-containing protein [Streptomyces sp. NPDC026673]|uniref:serine hydrolase domain-containing protein n=1 Tax=Streptomyces sp. NPDC026673 TaxID=3155724 RepID=UPI0033FA12A6
MRPAPLAVTALLSAALAVPLAAPGFAAPALPAASTPLAATAHTPSAGEALRQKALDDLVAAGVPGVIAEVRDARGVWTGKSGRADLHHRRPLATDGRFRAGSVTKSFVATTVLQLVAERRVALDAPVARYLPGLVPHGRDITVRQLLGHRSGLHNYTDSLWSGSLQELYRNRFRTWAPRELVAESARHAPDFAPGTAGHYSNTNYVLLGMLIERVTGDTAEHEITRRILKPLGLRHTSFPGTSVRIPGPHARGYQRLDGPDSAFTDITEENMSWAWTAGALISTSHDLNRFFAALIGGRLLPPALLREMKEARPMDRGPRYGLGLSVLDSPAYGTAYGHTGGAPGYGTYSFTTADNKRQVTIAINTLADTEAMSRAADEALETLLRPEAKPE